MMTTTTTESTTPFDFSLPRGIVTILRHSAVSAADIHRSLLNEGLSNSLHVVIEANFSVTENHERRGGPAVVVDKNRAGDKDGIGMRMEVSSGIDNAGAAVEAATMVVAPSHTVRHYIPDVRSYVVSCYRYDPTSATGVGVGRKSSN